MTAKERVAVDLDSTLAASMVEAFTLIEGPDHKYGYDDIDDWDWPIEEFGADRFLSAIWNVWSIRPTEIEPIENGLAEKLSLLKDQYRVDIVTTQPDYRGISRGKKDWLECYSIPYDKFVPHEFGEPKTELDYKFFIDDKPELPATANDEQVVFVRDHPYNRHIDSPHVHVGSVKEAASLLRENTETPGNLFSKTTSVSAD